MGEDLLLRAGKSWHPIAAESDLVYRHVFQGQLLGQELAVWRADDDHVNVWENRCLHRGVRLSVAMNDGRELKCQYHGWRYANRTAACTYIPAHPADAPARTITNRTYPVRTSGGMVWTALAEPTDEPPELDAGLVLRPMPVRARPENVVALLVEHPPALPDAAPPAARRCGDFIVEVEGVGFFAVQPVDADRAIIRGVLTGQASAGRLRLLRHFDGALTRFREIAQEREADEPAPEPLSPRYEPVPKHLASLPAGSEHLDLPTRVRVVRTWEAGAGVRGLELGPVGDRPLPSGQPGSHLDVALPGGLVRQYSLVNAPGETGHYVIGVKLTPDSAGGSVSLHERVREGDVLAVSLPRNNFPLRRDRERTVLVAGGIGITPLLAMAQMLEHQELHYELHYFAAREADVSFKDRLARLGNVRTIIGLDPAETTAELERLLGATDHEDCQVYVCGPPPMLDTARDVAHRAGWPREAVHFEYFRNDQEIDESSRFEIVLARSVMNLTVEPGRSILETVREAGVTIPSSCEQGACGTCRVAVIDGQPDHQDVYLDEDERAAGDSMMTCVSRSLTDRLTLDL
ncbi:Rieske 2Fe-2S domain-containing protein [Saccharopolyspora sp. WRP15-2]|uniref:Rieske 2Fe-2S domain-containing protein n=1 Tax=Saccharopolyspora oryzae TaxID=2997343 RepID=A0ABT4UWN9_9PSEU|nr:Rieske 2Fe-2S domain-containing protein [Saccharopolyspora oryzae]MDA3626089.1 Rieske 2Fe-2S domain-containing protein [Saccharopolyspora oryzae]